MTSLLELLGGPCDGQVLGPDDGAGLVFHRHGDGSVDVIVPWNLEHFRYRLRNKGDEVTADYIGPDR